MQGQPGLRINPICVDDAIQVFQPGLDCQQADLFNVAGDDSVTITDLAKLIENLTGCKNVVKYAKGILQGDLIGDNSRMKDILMVLPEFSLVEGLRKMLQQ